MSERAIPKCPRCGGRPGAYLEFWTACTVEFLVTAAGAPQKDGNVCPGVPAGRVDATCDGCGHRWRLRGVSQITELQPHAAQTTEGK